MLKEIVDLIFNLSDMRDISLDADEYAEACEYDVASMEQDGDSEVPLGKRVY